MRRYIYEINVGTDPEEFLKKKVKKIVQTKDGAVKEVRNYDEYGKEIKTLTYDKRGDGKIIESTYSSKSKYNKRGQILAKERYYNGELFWKCQYKHSKDGEIREIYEMEIRHGEENITHCKHDKYGNEIFKRETTVEEQSENYKQYTEYYFDKITKKRDGGRVLWMKKYEEGPEGDRLIHIVKNIYNEDGYLRNKFEEEKLYYGDLNMKREEKLIENKDEMKITLKRLKRDLKAFLEKRVEYRYEEISIIREESSSILWDDNDLVDRGIVLEPKVKIKLLVANDSGSWNRKKYTKNVKYVKFEGYTLVRKIEGGGKEEISISDMYEYDLQKKLKGRYLEQYVSKYIYDSKNREICSLTTAYVLGGYKEYTIEKSKYEGDNLIEKTRETRLCKGKVNSLGRRRFKDVKRYIYDEKGNKIKKEEYEIVGNQERLVGEYIYNKEGDIIDIIVYEKNKRKQKLKTVEAFNEKSDKKLVISNEEGLICVMEEDKDGDPRLMVELSEQTIITKIEYYEGEYY